MWVCELYRPNFDLSGRISADRSYFRKWYPYNSFPFKMSALIRISYFCSSNFIFFATFCENSAFTYLSRSSSGWVLMDLKVLPSKSSYFQLHFSYLSCLHISHQSKVTSRFRQKISRLTSFYRPYQLFTLKTLFWGFAWNDTVSQAWKTVLSPKVFSNERLIFF